MYGSEGIFNVKTVAFDFDDTISAHPKLFMEIMELMEAYGWFVVVVTYRHPDCYPEDLQFLLDKGFKVVFTAQTAKKEYMERVEKTPIDIWIDDDPASVLFHYSVVDGTHYRNGVDFKAGTV